MTNLEIKKAQRDNELMNALMLFAHTQDPYIGWLVEVRGSIEGFPANYYKIILKEGDAEWHPLIRLLTPQGEQYSVTDLPELFAEDGTRLPAHSITDDMFRTAAGTVLEEWRHVEHEVSLQDFMQQAWYRLGGTQRACPDWDKVKQLINQLHEK